MLLSKTAGLNALAGNLTIGDGSGTDTVQLVNANQIADTSSVTFFTGGVLDLNGQSESINGLVSTSLGDGAVTSSAAGSIAFGVGAGNATSTFSGVIQDGSGTVSLTKLGTGVLTLSGSAANTFTGLTAVSAGTLILGKTAGVNAIGGNLSIGDGSGTDTVQLANDNQIPDAASVTLSSGGVLDLNGHSETIDGLTSNSAGVGTVTSGATGAVTLGVGAAGATGNFSGVIQNGSGTVGLTKLGAGSLTMSGSSANTYTGITTVSAGTLVLSKTAGVNAVGGNLIIGDGSGTDTVRLASANQIANSASVTFFTGGILDLNGQSETIDGLASNAAGDGTITSGTAGAVTFGVGAGVREWQFQRRDPKRQWHG